VICVSRAEEAMLLRHFGDDLDVVIAPNGVEVEEILRALPLETGRRSTSILSAGRLEPYKQVERVVSVLAALPADHELVVLGTGPAGPGIRDRVRQLSLADRVQLLGHVPTGVLHQWLRTADVFVSLSRHEAFGITVLEAAVAGAGVVASDIPAHREVAGYLPPGAVTLVRDSASVEELALAIGRARRREVMHDDLSRVPRWEDTVTRTLAAYTIAVGGSPDQLSLPRAS
jgi:glycosyltransferase involved in cell wall biosynthesis